MPEVLKIASNITNPLGILGLLAALGFFAYSRWLKHQERKLTNLPEEERARQTDLYLTRYGVDGAGLSIGTKAKLIREEMQARHRRSLFYVMVAAVVFVLCFALSVLGRPTPPEPGRPFRVYCVENKDPAYTYSKDTQKLGLTNYEDILPILQRMGISDEAVDLQLVSPGFTGYDTMARRNPDLVLMHVSAFDVPRQPTAARGMLDLLRVMGEHPGSKTQFVIYGRSLPRKPKGEADWVDQVIRLSSGKLRGRIHLVPIDVGRYPDNPFRDPDNIRRISEAVRPFAGVATGGST